MDDHHHHLFFSVYENPSVDGIFAADKPKTTLTDLPPPAENVPHGGANIGGDRDRLSNNDIDVLEDYNAWLSICDDVSPNTTVALVDNNINNDNNGGDNHRGGTEAAGPSGTSGERCCGVTGEDHGRYYAPENMGAPPVLGNNDDHGDGQNLMRPLQPWPAQTVPFNCSFCHVLREIIHVHYEYNNYMKLEIHGRIGVISHAIHERKITIAANNTSENESQFELLDFSSKSTEEVKHFLTSYCSQRSEEGYAMSNDPLSTFYEALSVGLSPPAIMHNTDLLSEGDSDRQNADQPDHQQQPVEQDREQSNKPETRRKTKRTSRRMSLAEQRKRTAEMKLGELSEVFHLALDKAAKKMQVCSTVLKRICRRGGINRWPYRKLYSVKKKIAVLQENLNSSDVETRAKTQMKIDALQREAMIACGGINIF